LHYRELNKLKVAQDLNIINEFNKFVNTFFSDKNVANCKILNSFNSINNKLKNLIKVNNNKIKIKYEKVEDNAKIIENKYRSSKYKDENNKNKN
jgi:hypothetical protein